MFIMFILHSASVEFSGETTATKSSLLCRKKQHVCILKAWFLEGFLCIRGCAVGDWNWWYVIESAIELANCACVCDIALIYMYCMHVFVSVCLTLCSSAWLSRHVNACQQRLTMTSKAVGSGAEATREGSSLLQIWPCCYQSDLEREGKVHKREERGWGESRKRDGDTEWEDSRGEPGGRGHYWRDMWVKNSPILYLRGEKCK